MKKINLFIILVMSTLLFSNCESDNVTEQNLEQSSQDLSASLALQEALSSEEAKAPKIFKPLKTVDFVDVTRYTGRWFELGNFPSFFSRNCTCTTADYAIIEDGLSVFNNCTSSVSGNFNDITGRAIVVDEESNAKLKVFLGGPIPGDYWIIDLKSFDDNKPYDFAVVSEPSRGSLFILSRTPQVNSVRQYRALVEIFVNLIIQGFDITDLELTAQNLDCNYAA